MLTEAFTNCKNEANSLVGLGLRESLLRLSDLCRHALQGRQRRPGNHNDVSCFSCATCFFHPIIFHLILTFTFITERRLYFGVFPSCLCSNYNSWSGSQVQHIPSLLSLLLAGPGGQPVEGNKHRRLHVASELGSFNSQKMLETVVFLSLVYLDQNGLLIIIMVHFVLNIQYSVTHSPLFLVVLEDLEVP